MRRFSTYELNRLISLGLDPELVASNISEDEPIEYYLKSAEFLGNNFLVDQNVLIPRLESEELINLALGFVTHLTAIDSNEVISFCDIGTGSGSIGISFALKLKERNIKFKAILSDISSDVLQVTQKNLNKLIGKTKRINIIKSDLITDYPKDLKFNIVFANLPYIPTSRIDTLSNSVKDFEPRIALDGGVDGLFQIRRLLNNIEDILLADSIVLFEVDDTHTDSSEFSSKWDIQIRNDFSGRNRYWICKLKSTVTDINDPNITNV